MVCSILGQAKRSALSLGTTLVKYFPLQEWNKVHSHMAQVKQRGLELYERREFSSWHKQNEVILHDTSKVSTSLSMSDVKCSNITYVKRVFPFARAKWTALIWLGQAIWVLPCDMSTLVLYCIYKRLTFCGLNALVR